MIRAQDRGRGCDLDGRPSPTCEPTKGLNMPLEKVHGWVLTRQQKTPGNPQNPQHLLLVSLFYTALTLKVENADRDNKTSEGWGFKFQ